MPVKDALKQVNFYLSSKVPSHVFLRFIEITQSIEDKYRTLFLTLLCNFFIHGQSGFTFNLKRDLFKYKDKFQELFDLLEGHIITVASIPYTYAEEEWIMWRASRI